MAELEAASVRAFEVLAAELEQYGAPQRLSEAARAAATDEVRHAASTAEWARALGANVAQVAVPARGVRSLAAIALDNAVEGCVRETFGAVIGAYQARAA